MRDRKEYYRGVEKFSGAAHRAAIIELGPTTDAQIAARLAGLRTAQEAAVRVRESLALAVTPEQTKRAQAAVERAERVTAAWRKALGVPEVPQSQTGLAERGGHRGSYGGRKVKR